MNSLLFTYQASGPQKKHPPGWLDEIWPSNINSSTIPITSTPIKRLGQDQHSRRISPPKSPQLPGIQCRHRNWGERCYDRMSMMSIIMIQFSIPGKKNNNPGVEKTNPTKAKTLRQSKGCCLYVWSMFFLTKNWGANSLPAVLEKKQTSTFEGSLFRCKIKDMYIHTCPGSQPTLRKEGDSFLMMLSPYYKNGRSQTNL